MLPDYETCRNHINAYKKFFKNPRPNMLSYPQFWDYKTGIENAGQNILDEKNIDTTAARLRSLLIYLDMQNSRVAEVDKIEKILKDIRPYYNEICRVPLGSGQIHSYRNALESIYERLGGITRNGRKSSIVGKSVILMAIWGQIPRFDYLNRRRFERWTPTPDPEKLPYLNTKKIWYEPDEFCEMIEKLDDWVVAWPKSNEGKSFINSFYDLCPGVPPGRQIDIIYHWELPNPWVDYQLQSRGS